MRTPQHLLVHFTGHVQGVGFRYTTVQVAKEFEVTGYVMNLADGRVKLEAEGDVSELKAFLEAIQERMHGHIRKSEQITSSEIVGYRGFLIR